MDKLKMHSPDLTQDNIARIRALFPGCVTEAADKNGKLRLAVNFDQLRQELSDQVVEGPQERYHLDWPGKREALLAANAPVAKTLRPRREDSVDFDATKNVFIEGDNLDALKLLQETYLSQVKLIYIDPPYNTGKEFIYDDDFADSADLYLARSNQTDVSGNRLVANTESNGRFHSDWLSMIYPRLRLARNLLREDGVIFISIDDHEADNLRKICDEVFGSENFIAQIIWHKMDSPKNSARHVSEDHDYVVIYARNAEQWRPTLLPRSKEMEARYKNPDNDARGPWLLGDLAARNPYSLGVYSITTPSGKVIEGPPPGSYWRVSRDKFDELDQDGRIWWGEAGTNRPGIKRFLSEVRDGVVPQTYWSWKDVGSTRNAKRDLSLLMKSNAGESLFDTPKPPRLIQRMLRIGTTGVGQELILDFFAGSASTAEAVIDTNRQDGGDRRYILVQIAEETGATDIKTISEFARLRIRKVGERLVTDQEEVGQASKLDTGFRAFAIDTSCMADVHYRPDAVKQDLLAEQIDNIRYDRTPEDLLFQVLLDWGVDLSLPIRQESIAGKTVFFVDETALAACFDLGVDEAFVKTLAAYKPLRVVFRDAGFASDSVKINVEQLFKLLSPATEVKTL